MLRQREIFFFNQFARVVTSLPVQPPSEHLPPSFFFSCPHDNAIPPCRKNCHAIDLCSRVFCKLGQSRFFHPFEGFAIPLRLKSRYTFAPALCANREIR